VWACESVLLILICHQGLDLHLCIWYMLTATRLALIFEDLRGI
jgi:hypothetical protein